jgi:hypothetical protein
MTIESIIAILALATVLGGILWILHVGKREAEMIFESDYENLKYFIKECDQTEEAELCIRLQLLRLSKMPGADAEKLQVLNSEFRRKFVEPTLGDVVADHESN